MPVDEYLSGLALELARRERATVPLETLYFGGGTPSRLGGDGISRAIDHVKEFFELDPAAEVTVEANPEDITAETVSAWVSAGVNRLSIGVQTFDDAVLQWMHRVHSSAESGNALEIARQGGIENISIDLIFALPGEVNRSWRDDLEQALSLEPQHISLYGLTIEPKTPLARWESRGAVTATGEDSYASEFLLAHEMAGDRGYHHYEVSNFAKPGFRSRHNSAYWTGAFYIGLGPSAHSFDGRTRSWNVPAYADWIARLERGDSVVADTEILDESNRASERVYLGLRTDDGFRATEGDIQTAARWAEQGWAKIDGDVVRLTPEGWLRLDSLASGLTGF